MLSASATFFWSYDQRYYMIDNQLNGLRKALIEWISSGTSEDLIVLKNKLDLCSYQDCFEEANLTVNHQKWCKKHYDKISGE